MAVTGGNEGGLIIFTLDALTSPGASGKYHAWRLLPSRTAVLRALADVGWVIGVVSNQDRVADGAATNRDYLYKIGQTQRLLDVPLDARVCYHRANARLSEFRDPNGVLRRLSHGEMLVELMLAHPAEARRGALFVGSGDYRPAAEAAGVDFMAVSEFFALLDKLCSDNEAKGVVMYIRLRTSVSFGPTGFALGYLLRDCCE